MAKYRLKSEFHAFMPDSLHTVKAMKLTSTFEVGVTPKWFSTVMRAGNAEHDFNAGGLFYSSLDGERKACLGDYLIKGKYKTIDFSLPEKVFESMYEEIVK